MINPADIAILIPCLNEEATIGRVVDDFSRELPGARIYVYDNASTDDTARVAAAHGATVCSWPQRGKGNVVRRMFADVEAQIYVLVDGDDTYPASAVHALIEPVAQCRADMVVGDRRSTTYEAQNTRPFHSTGNSMVCSVINRLWGVRLNDVLSGYRAFSRDFVKKMPVMSTGFEIESELTIHAIDNDYRIAEVPVEYRERTVGSHSKLNTFSDGTRVLGTIFGMFRDYRPLAFFSILGAVTAVVAIVLLVPVFVDYFRTGLVERFPTLIFGCFVMTGALLLFAVGIILQVLRNQNRRFMRALPH